MAKIRSKTNKLHRQNIKQKTTDSWFQRFWPSLVAGLIVLLIGIIIKEWHDHHMKIALIKEKVDSAELLSQEGLIQKALDICSDVIIDINKDNEPEIFAHIKNIEGVCYFDLSDIEFRERNLRLAIQAHKDGRNALQNTSRSIGYALNSANLGNAYSSLADIRLKDNYIDSAKAAYDDAIKALSETRYDNISLTAKGNIAILFTMLAENCADMKMRRNYLIKAIADFMEVIDYERTIQNNTLLKIYLINIGNTYGDLSSIENKIENLYQAKSAFEEAKKFDTLEEDSFTYSKIQNNLGQTLLDLAEATDSVIYIEQSISIYNDILKIFTFNEHPWYYAGTNNNLGNAYMELGKRASINMTPLVYNEAIKCYKEALKVRTVVNYPLDYAQTIDNLGETYYALALIQDKITNFGQAVSFYNEELKVYSLDGYPLGYAKANARLGSCFRNLAEDSDKINNLIKAAGYFKKSLQVYTVDGFSNDFANSNYQLGNVLMALYRLTSKTDYLCEAISSWKKSLLIYTTQRSPDFYNKIDGWCKQGIQEAGNLPCLDSIQ
jgi:tetratricopeptide (TPR) repeat protein